MRKKEVGVDPPRCGRSHPDRDLECEQAMEAAFIALAECAEAAGWGTREVADALVELAYNRWVAIDENSRMMEECAGVFIPAKKLN